VDGKDKCIGGKIIEGQCYCPPTKKLDKYECVIADGKCKGGKILNGLCLCPPDRFL
jgi:hypothetical protein